MARIISIKKYMSGQNTGEFMKKMWAILILLNCTVTNAYEYSSDIQRDDYSHEHEHEDWIDSNSRHTTPLRKKQSYSQPPIQIYLTPNQNSYSHDERKSHRSDNKQYQEEHYWRERREELEYGQPYLENRPYSENPFYHDDSHW